LTIILCETTFRTLSIITLIQFYFLTCSDTFSLEVHMTSFLYPKIFGCLLFLRSMQIIFVDCKTHYFYETVNLLIFSPDKLTHSAETPKCTIQSDQLHSFLIFLDTIIIVIIVVPPVDVNFQ
jgi:hypothetical protein